jgi:hypothetical protein
MYGSRVFVRIPEEQRRSKWDKRAEVGILLGYTDTGYRVLLNKKVIVVRNCDIIEEDVKLCGFENEEENKIEGKEKENQDKRDDADETDVTESENERKERRTRRQVKPDEEYGYYFIYCNYCDPLAPSDFQEATTCGEPTRWKEAMNSEMD